MKTTTTATRNYELFRTLCKNNRPLNPGKHKALRDSMIANGFDPDQPIMCYREGGRLVVWDGQHRLHFARELGIPVYYRETEKHSPLEFNASAVGWSIDDYVYSHIGSGNASVAELQAFREKYKLPVTTCEMLLCGRVGSIHGTSVKSGEVKINDREFAHRVAATIQAIAEVFPYAKNLNCITAVARFCRVPEFLPEQLINKLRACPGLLVRQATVDQYSAVLEEIYNRDQKRNRLPLKFMADEVMNKRNFAVAKK